MKTECAKITCSNILEQILGRFPLHRPPVTTTPTRSGPIRPLCGATRQQLHDIVVLLPHSLPKCNLGALVLGRDSVLPSRGKALHTPQELAKTRPLLLLVQWRLSGGGVIPLGPSLRELANATPSVGGGRLAEEFKRELVTILVLVSQMPLTNSSLYKSTRRNNRPSVIQRCALNRIESLSAPLQAYKTQYNVYCLV